MCIFGVSSTTAMSRFQIGGKVVCIKSHAEGATTKGSIYIVQGFGCCKFCGRLALDLGIPDPPGFQGTQCVSCMIRGSISPVGWFQGAERFAPLLDQGMEAVLDGIEEEVDQENLVLVER